MALGDPINIRLTPEKQAIFEEQAAAQGKRLGTYLRERLEGDESARAELDALRHELGLGLTSIRHAVEDGLKKRGSATQSTTSTSSQINDGLLLEMVLLLRAIGGPEKMKVAQAEIKRQGLNAWTPKKD